MRLILNNFPFLFVIVSFMPYLSLSAGLKYDDVAVYGTTALMFLYILASKTLKINKSMLGILITWTILLIYLFFRTLIGGGSANTQSFLADLNNLLQPFSVILLFTCLTQSVSKEKHSELLRKCGKALIFLLSLNTVWIIAGFIFDTTPVNIYFWGGEESTAAKAMQNNRFSGIFNQPVEAGMTYALGLLVWLYLVGKQYMGLGFISISVLLLMFIGGSLSVSKAFVLLGVGLFFVGVVLNKRVLKRILPISLLFIALGYPAFKYLTEKWNGLNYLTRLFDSENYQSQGLLNMLTAGRYGSENSQQSNFFQNIWQNAPLIGEGLGSQTTYDSAHFYFFSTGGLISLFGYIVIVVILLWMVYEFFFYDRSSYEFKLFFGIIILVILGGLGAPTLTLNRSSLPTWVFIGLLLQHLCALKMIRAGRLKEVPLKTKKKKRRKLFKRYRLTW